MLEGRSLSLREGGAGLYLVNGMSREATQEPGGGETPGVMETIGKRALSEEVVPEIRPAINEACTLLDAQSFVVDLDNDSCFDGEEAVGSEKRGGRLCGVPPILRINGISDSVNCAPLSGRFFEYPGQARSSSRAVRHENALFCRGGSTIALPYRYT